MGDAVAEEQKPPYHDRICRNRPLDDWGPIAIDILNPRAENADLRMRFQIPELLFQPRGQTDIVGVHTGDVFTIRNPEYRLSEAISPQFPWLYSLIRPSRAA